MKKFLAVLIAIVLIFALAACNNAQSGTNNPSTGTSPASSDEDLPLKGKRIGITVVTLANPDIKSRADQLVKLLEEQGAECNLMSAEGDWQLQLEQVENFVAQGYDDLGIHPVNTEALQSAVADAMAKGITCTFFGGKPDYPYTAYSGSNNEKSGKVCADMAMAFIEEEYPDASAENPVEVILLSNYKTQILAVHANAVIAALKNEPRVKIVLDDPDQTDELITTQAKVEEQISSYPNVKIWIGASESTAIGASNAIMSIYGSGKGYATFAATCSDVGKELVEKSNDDLSAVRGLIYFPTVQVAWFNAMYGAITGKYSNSYTDWIEIEPITTTSYVFAG